MLWQLKEGDIIDCHLDKFRRKSKVKDFMKASNEEIWAFDKPLVDTK